MDRAMRLEVPYDGIRQVAYGPCTIAEYKGIEYLAENHVTGRRRKRHTCPCQGVRCGINGQLGGLRKALFRRKGDEARNYGFAFIGVDKGTVTPRTVGERGRRASGLLGITAGILEHMLSALCGKPSMKAINCLIVRKI